MGELSYSLLPHIRVKYGSIFYTAEVVPFYSSKESYVGNYNVLNTRGTA